MIAGIGTDVVQVLRLQRALERQPKRLPKRLLASSEREQFDLNKNKARFLAKRFAAKEAVLKALGTGLRGMSWQDIAISHSDLGQPMVQLSGPALIKAQERSITRWHLTISDEQDYAVAFAIAETSA